MIKHHTPRRIGKILFRIPFTILFVVHIRLETKFIKKIELWKKEFQPFRYVVNGSYYGWTAYKYGSGATKESLKKTGGYL